MSNLLAEPDARTAVSASTQETRGKIGLYGNFGAGNLGNDCTLFAVIEQLARRMRAGDLRCFCTDPQKISEQAKIASYSAEAPVPPRRRPGILAKVLRVAFHRIPAEITHWLRTLLIVSDLEMLIVAGTGVVQDAACGPFGAPYIIFKFALLAAICRVKLVFLNVGVGPIDHPLSRWFIRRSLSLAKFRAYRDEASRKYLAHIGFYSAQDRVCPDVVFGLPPVPAPSSGRGDRRRIIGVGLKDSTSQSNSELQLREYLEAMVAFVVSLQHKGYAVRLLIGDTKYDTVIVTRFVEMLKERNFPAGEPYLLVEPASNVETLLRQIAETDVVISARYHNLVMAMLHGKPVIVVSDHPKFDSLATETGLGRYLVPMASMSGRTLIDKFQELDSEIGDIRNLIGIESRRYRAKLEAEFDDLVLLARASDSRCVRA